VTYSIIFDKVTKIYSDYGHITAGFKNLVVNFYKIRRKANKQFIALENISFKVKKGECWGVVGRNGAGKSTLLGLIAGVLKPNKGKVTVNGRVLPLLELGAGFHPDLTGRENIILNAVLLGLTRKEAKKRLEAIIEFSELRDFIDQPLRTYSSGMIARLGFSIMAHLDPDILLIDEVLAVGDLSFQRKCMYAIEAFKKKGVTIMLVTHNINDILSLCDKALWLENHKIKMLGNVETVINAYKMAMQ